MSGGGLIKVLGVNNVILVTTRENWDEAHLDLPGNPPAAVFHDMTEQAYAHGSLGEVEMFATSAEEVPLNGGHVAIFERSARVFQRNERGDSKVRLFTLASISQVAEMCGLALVPEEEARRTMPSEMRIGATAQPRPSGLRIGG